MTGAENRIASRFTWTLLAVGALLLGVAWIFASREPAVAQDQPDAPVAPLVGHVAPDFTLDTVTGETFTLTELRGQPVVLNFWATWCPPCRVEIPFFAASQTKYSGQVAIIGVDDGEPLSTVAPFVREMGINYPVPLDTESKVSIQYRVNALPATFFIDREGIIQHIQFGLVNQAVLEAEIAALLAP